MLTPTSTLVFAMRDGQVLLGHKKRGLGAGKITGIGGKIEPGESVRAAAVRELDEEAGLIARPEALLHAAELDFCFPNKASWQIVVRAFVITDWTGEPTECEEIAPFWAPLDGLPFARMWDDGQYWLPGALRGAPARWLFVYGSDNTRVHVARRMAVSREP
ncbi:MAG: 8-oxo-dGTP diphosphatase [Thermoflexales bacterium]